MMTNENKKQNKIEYLLSIILALGAFVVNLPGFLIVLFSSILTGDAGGNIELGVLYLWIANFISYYPAVLSIIALCLAIHKGIAKKQVILISIIYLIVILEIVLTTLLLII